MKKCCNLFKIIAIFLCTTLPLSAQAHGGGDYGDFIIFIVIFFFVDGILGIIICIGIAFLLKAVRSRAPKSLLVKVTLPKLPKPVLLLLIGLPLLFAILTFTEDYFRERASRDAGHQGGYVAPGGAQKLMELEEHRYRLWGTGIQFSRDEDSKESFLFKRVTGFMNGIGWSRYLKANEPLLLDDRKVLEAWLERNSSHEDGSNLDIRAKLVWDALEGGKVLERKSQIIATIDSSKKMEIDPSVRSPLHTTFYVLSCYVEKYGHQKFCSGGNILEEDRIALSDIINSYPTSDTKEIRESLDKLCKEPARDAKLISCR